MLLTLIIVKIDHMSLLWLFVVLEVKRAMLEDSIVSITHSLKFMGSHIKTTRVSDTSKMASSYGTG